MYVFGAFYLMGRMKVDLSHVLPISGLLSLNNSGMVLMGFGSANLIGIL
jgi:hypothetical protein